MTAPNTPGAQPIDGATSGKNTGSLVAHEQPVDADRDLEDQLYGSDQSLSQAYKPLVEQNGGNALRDRHDWDDQQFGQHVLQVAHGFNDARIPRDEVPKLYGLLAQHLASPPDPETFEKWEIESRRYLREQFGREEGQRRLVAVTKFFDQRPELKQMLKVSGVGSHPDLVKAFTAAPHNLRMTPRAKPTSTK